MRSTIFFTLLLVSMTAFAQQPQLIEVGPNQSVEVTGNLSAGAPMSDLSWAWNSSVACFPETQKLKFTGNHVLYSAMLPKYSEMEVTVIPDDQQANFSIYAYEVGVNSDAIVPNLPRCIRCEADHKWDYNKRGQVQDHTRTVKDLVAINNPYKVIIGITGAEGLQEGGYTVRVSVKSR